MKNIHSKSFRDMKLDENMIRHMVVNGLRSYISQFKLSYGELVICCDSKNYWRREVYPFYKQNRKKNRDETKYDWVAIFQFLDKIKAELKENFPHKLIEVSRAEADDIIAVLTKTFSTNENILIVSSDKDFMQLQKYENVLQYSPILKKFIKTETPKQFVLEHILVGDRGDGIPNFLSADNTFAIGERQKTLSKKRLQECLISDIDTFCNTESLKQRYARNRTLIDFDYIPNELANQIIETYNSTEKNKKSKFFQYMIDYKLRNLMENLNDF